MWVERLGCDCMTSPSPMACCRKVFPIPMIALVLLVLTAQAEDWPQFRGRNATGISHDSRNLPIEFSPTKNLRWQAELGEGISSPIVVAGRVFATALVAPEKLVVFCFDAATGVRLWRRDFDTGPLPVITPPNRHASSTPVADRQRVCVYFSTLGLLMLDAADGRLLWQRRLPQPYYQFDWGAAQSPVFYDNIVIFNQDDDLAPFLVAVDKVSGDVVWRTERPDMLAGYATPVFCQAHGRTDLVVAGTGMLKGYDPATGGERWTCNSLPRTIMSSPVVVNDVIFVSTDSYGDADRVLKLALLDFKDANKDGKLEKSELGPAFTEKFNRGDVNTDGFLEGDEIDNAFQSPANMVGGGRTVQAVRGGGDGDVTKTHLVWRLDVPATSQVVSPLVVDGRLMLFKNGGIANGFSTTDGSVISKPWRIGNIGNYFASPVSGDGKIYLPGENGRVVVLRDGDKLETLAVNDLGEDCLATPAIADDHLYFRTLNKLYCFDNTPR